MEGQTRCLADEILEALGIAKAGHLYQNPIVALPLDDRLGGSHLVDTAADHLERLSHERGHAAGNGVLGQSDQDTTTRRANFYLRRRCPAPENSALDRLCKGLKRLSCCIKLAGIGQFNIERRAVSRNQAPDSGLDQRGARIAPDVADPALDDVVAVDLQQKMRPALQIETEHDFLAWQPVRHSGLGLLAEEIRQDRQDAEQRHQKNGDGPEWRDLHGKPSFLNDL